RFWHMLVQSKTFLPMFKWWSPMSVGSWLILIFPMFLFISFVDALIAMRRLTVGPWSYRQTLHGSPLGLAWSIVGGFIAFAVTAYSGTLLTATSFPGWKDSTVIGALFVATGLVTGVAAVQMVQALRGRTEEEDALRLERASTWLLVWWLAVLAVFLVLGLLSGAARAFLSGPSLVAIVGAILIGGIAPLVLQRLETRRTRPRLTAVWAALILVGGYLLRYAVVMGPQHG
ncbi:MAG: polysulfide reductase NrfD, partial [Chloroflexi bacterium]|nr:polysulfide reductase NrfD [Chloroflexota bacterium]